MAEHEKETKQPDTHPKRKIRNEVYAKLTEALAGFKNGSPEKEFAESIRRASKILAKDFAKSEKKSATKQDKIKKKTVGKKTKQQ